MQRRIPLSARVFATLSVLGAAGTYAAAGVDFLLRHRPGISPTRYWPPQLKQVWLPGLGTSLLFAGLTFVLARRAAGGDNGTDRPTLGHQ